MGKVFRFFDDSVLEIEEEGVFYRDKEGNTEKYAGAQGELLRELVERGGKEKSDDLEKEMTCDVSQTLKNIRNKKQHPGGLTSEHIKQQNGYVLLVDPQIVWAEDRIEMPDLQPDTRETVERKFSITNRFGKTLISFIKNCRERPKESDFSGFDMKRQPVSRIWFSGYAGTTFWEPDHSAREQRSDGESFYFQDIFKVLLRDPDFQMELVLTEPYSAGAQDAIRFGRLGNERFKGEESAVFTSSATELKRLWDDTSSEYGIARANHRLYVAFTQQALPYAMFLCEYKEKFHKLGYRDHLKLDLYASHINQTKARPCLVVFKDKEPILYDRLRAEFQCMINHGRSIEEVTEEEWKNWALDWEFFQKGRMSGEKKPFILRQANIEKAFEVLGEYGTKPRQYFIGDLERGQELPFVRMGDFEVGCTLYSQECFFNDSAHYHSRSSEILYIQEGGYEVSFLPGDTYILSAGDFAVIPPNTPYSGKALKKDTRVLFMKLGGNDKVSSQGGT